MKVGPQPEFECPVDLATLNRLRGAEGSEVVGSVASLAEDVPIKLALYCYNRSLRPLGLTVASTVDPELLAKVGGTLGEALAEQSRATGLSFGTEPIVEPKKRAEKAKPKVSVGGRGWVDR